MNIRCEDDGLYSVARNGKKIAPKVWILWLICGQVVIEFNGSRHVIVVDKLLNEIVGLFWTKSKYVVDLVNIMLHQDCWRKFKIIEVTFWTNEWGIIGSEILLSSLL